MTILIAYSESFWSNYLIQADCRIAHRTSFYD